MTHAWLLAFTICIAADPAHEFDRCEEGTIAVRSCEAGEAWLRAGLRNGQTLHLSGCTRMEVAAR